MKTIKLRPDYVGMTRYFLRALRDTKLTTSQRKLFEDQILDIARFAEACAKDQEEEENAQPN